MSAAALRSYTYEAAAWEAQGFKNLKAAAAIEGSVLAVGAAYVAGKAAMSSYEAIGATLAQTYDTLTSKSSALQQATENGTLALSDFSGTLRSFGLSSLAGTFDWIDKWSSGTDAVAAKSAQLSQQLRAMREDFKSLSAEISAASLSASLSGPVSRNDATAAATALVATPNFNTSALSLKDYIKDANNLAVVLGITVPAAAGKLVAAVNDTASAAKAAQAQGMVGFNTELINAITNAQAAGDRIGALSLYMQALHKDIDNAATPIGPFAQAMRNFYALFEGRDSAGPMDGFFKSVHNALEETAAWCVRQITAITGAFLKGKDAVTNFFGGNTGPAAPANATDMIQPTQNMRLARPTRR